MFNFFKKKPYVRFVNTIPGVEIAHPIIRSHEARHEWIRNAAVDFKQKQANQSPTDRLNSISRCPGVSGLNRLGFIVPNPIDFVITTSLEEPNIFHWDCAERMSDGSDYIGSHSMDQLAKYIPFREDTIAPIVKVHTNWKISASPDIVFLVMPIAYPDHNVFSSAHGILDPHQTMEINVQLFWHKKQGSALIRAGTPLTQLIPIPRELSVDLKVERATPEDLYKSTAWNYIQRRNYSRDIKEYFNLTKKLFKKD